MIIVDVEFNGVQVLQYEAKTCPRVGECITLLQPASKGGTRKYKVAQVDHFVCEVMGNMRQTTVRVSATVWGRE